MNTQGFFKFVFAHPIIFGVSASALLMTLVDFFEPIGAFNPSGGIATSYSFAGIVGVIACMLIIGEVIFYSRALFGRKTKDVFSLKLSALLFGIFSGLAGSIMVLPIRSFISDPMHYGIVLLMAMSTIGLIGAGLIIVLGVLSLFWRFNKALYAKARKTKTGKK